jgi:hypothetical protein
MAEAQFAKGQRDRRHPIDAWAVHQREVERISVVDALDRAASNLQACSAIQCDSHIAMLFSSVSDMSSGGEHTRQYRERRPVHIWACNLKSVVSGSACNNRQVNRQLPNQPTHALGIFSGSASPIKSL